MQQLCVLYICLGQLENQVCMLTYIYYLTIIIILLKTRDKNKESYLPHVMIWLTQVSQTSGIFKNDNIINILY